MDRAADAELLQSYLDHELSADEARQLEARVCAEPALADMLLVLARQESILIEWASATAAIRTIDDVEGRKARPHGKRWRWAARTWRLAAGIALLLAAGGALWLRKSPQVNRPVDIGRVVSAENNVKVRRGNELLTVNNGFSLLAGDCIETERGARAELAYADWTTLSLGGETTASFADGQGCPAHPNAADPGKSVTLRRGSLSATVAKQPSGKPLLIHTPQALCTVVGTELRVSVAEEGTRLEVASGTVRFQRRADSAEVAVAAGSYAVAEAPDERTAPPTLVALPLGRRFFAAPDGSPRGDGSLQHPWDLASALPGLQAGDTLLLKPGIYAQPVMETLPSGESWDQPVTLTALDPGNRPVLSPQTGDYVLHFHQTSGGEGVHHVVVRGIVLDAAHVTENAVLIESPASHIRLIDCELKNSHQSGLVTFGEQAEGNEFIRLDVHDNGTTDLNHGIDIGSAANRIEGSKIYKNAGWGVHVYAEKIQIEGNAVIGNFIWDNARVGPLGPGIGLYSGAGHRAVNNVIWGNACGIQVAEGASNAGIYHNTIALNHGHGIDVEPTAGAGIDVVNNIVSRNDKEGIALDCDAGARLAGNLCFQNGLAAVSEEAEHKDVLDLRGTGTLTGNLFNRDPLFANAERGDFHLLAQSAAAGAAAPLEERDAARDADRIQRPAARAIGAYEPGQ